MYVCVCARASACREENILRVFENKVLWRMLGRNREEGSRC
jgi:hypothetical protein